MHDVIVVKLYAVNCKITNYRGKSCCRAISYASKKKYVEAGITVRLIIYTHFFHHVRVYITNFLTGIFCFNARVYTLPRNLLQKVVCCFKCYERNLKTAEKIFKPRVPHTFAVYMIFFFIYSTFPSLNKRA